MNRRDSSIATPGAPGREASSSGSRGVSPWESVGNTPLLRLSRVTRGLPPGVAVLAKAEWMNPGGSIKDRPAARMIQEGVRAGLLGPGRTIIDATSGNTGIAYAMIGAALGYPVRICAPATRSLGVLGILRAYGADLVLTDQALGMDGSSREVQRLVAESPDEYFFPDQMNNQANWRAHYDGTGNEVWQQTGGTVTHFVAGVGTGGTLVGTGRRLRERNPGVEILCVQPASPLHGLEGVRHLETTIVPRIFDPGLVDRTISVETEAAQAMVVRLAREEGIFVGVSAGANVAAALRAAEGLKSGVVVTVLPESGRRFVNQFFWEKA